MGYPRVRELFEVAAAKTPEEIISALADAAEEWGGTRPLEDDITFVVLKMK
jgi:serine phosphatase RsbU (regulator of sigma subunit)